MTLKNTKFVFELYKLVNEVMPVHNIEVVYDFVRTAVKDKCELMKQDEADHRATFPEAYEAVEEDALCPVCKGAASHPVTGIDCRECGGTGLV